MRICEEHALTLRSLLEMSLIQQCTLTQLSCRKTIAAARVVLLMGLCLCAEAVTEFGEDVEQGREVRSLFFFLIFFSRWRVEWWSRATVHPKDLAPSPLWETKGAFFSKRSAVTWEAAVNVGHVSGLLLLRLSAFPPQLWCLRKPQEFIRFFVSFLIHYSLVIVLPSSTFPLTLMPYFLWNRKAPLGEQSHIIKD